MKHVMTAALVAGLLAGGVVQAQTTTANPTGSTMGTTSGTTTMGAPATSTTTMGSPALGVSNPSMARPSTSTSPAALTTTTAPSRTTAAPVAGANSFTESEARTHIQDKGFANVTGLKKDEKGVWRGMAMKSGKQVAVALDYQGNVVGQ